MSGKKKLIKKIIFVAHIKQISSAWTFILPLVFLGFFFQFVSTYQERDDG